MVAPSVIFDIGGFMAKIGFGSENEPRNTFFTITGTPKYTAIGVDNKKQVYVGNEIIEALGLYKISYPIEKGEIVDWEMFEAIIEYAFYLLRIDPSTVNVLFSTSPFLSIDSKKRLFDIFLEKFQVMGFYPVLGALLTMYSGGFETGLVVDMGAQFIKITPIYQGFIVKHAVKYLELGGTVIDNYLAKKIAEMGYGSGSSVQRELVRVLKERACFVSLNYDEDLKHASNFTKEFSMPDGSLIKIGVERFVAPELLFQPDLNNIELESIQQAIVDTIQLCDIDIRRDLLNNIFLTGGTSMIPGLNLRLKQEIENLLTRMGKQEQNIRIIAAKERIISNWVGGSILSTIPDFQNNWVTRKQFYDTGIPQNLLES